VIAARALACKDVLNMRQHARDPRLEALRKGGRRLPEEVRGDLADALARLDQGLMLSMPLSRPMPAIGRGVHELRFRDRSGIYRVIYFLRRKNEIWLVHAFKKKTQKTPAQNIEVARGRIRRLS
jgi:phage-related protein